MKLIDKDALIAEIEEWRNEIVKGIFSIPLTGRDKSDATFEYEILGRVRDFIDSLNTKEVDLEKEIDDYVNEYFSECGDGVLISDANSMELTLLDITPLAKHFFELGIKAQKGE